LKQEGDVSKNSHHRNRIGRLRLSLPVALMLMAVLFGSVAATAQAQPAAQTKVLIAFAHQPGPAEQALVHRFGGDIRYTYHLYRVLRPQYRRRPWTVYAVVQASSPWSLMCRFT
jgi:hypothetical protein